MNLINIITTALTYRKHIKQGGILNATIFIDRSTGNIWCNYYSDYTSYTEYHDKNIISLHKYLFSTDVTIGGLIKAVRKAMNEYKISSSIAV